ncbi:unnamed protein product, partial [Musa acuminata var. zebrina]
LNSNGISSHIKKKDYYHEQKDKGRLLEAIKICLPHKIFCPSTARYKNSHL